MKTDGTLTASYAIYGFSLAGLFYSVFAFRLLHARQNPRFSGVAHTALLGAVIASAGWGWSEFAVLTLHSQAAVLLSTSLDLVRYGCWFAFLLIPLRQSTRTGPHISQLLDVIAAVVMVGAIACLTTEQFFSGPAHGYSRNAMFVSLALAVLGLVLIEQLFRNAAEDLRWFAKPLCLALACVFVFDFYTYSQAILFGTIESDATSIRGAMHAVAVPLLFVASRREADWISKFQVSRTTAFHSAAIFLAGTYLLFISAVGYYVRYFGGEWGHALQVALSFVALIILTFAALSGTIRSKMKVWLGKNFFRYQYDYRQEWLRFTDTLSAKGSPNQMGESVIRGLANLLESPGGSLWCKATDGNELLQTARWNMPGVMNRESLDSAFARFLCERRWIISLDELRAFPASYDGIAVPGWIASSPNAWVVVPLLVGDDLTGFVVLARPRAAVELNWEVIDLLKTASRQAASFLAQAHATEALLEVRKFDAFNRMSAFVVHDLKNIVTQLSLMMKNAKRLHDNPEFQRDMLMTVENSLEKMRQLMLQLREGEVSPSGFLGVDLAPIARSIEALTSRRGRRLEVELVDRVVARGHEQRIERVLGHMVQNALDATPVSGRVWIKVERASGRAKVEVGDTGHGMSQDFIHNRLFKPFHTTKESGMGIGAYESYQYVRELGGNISVDSQIHRGTTITIYLPLFEARHGSDLHSLSIH